MPIYHVKVDVTYSGTESYEIEADNPEDALEIAKSGDVPSVDDDLSCDSTDWDTATVDEMEGE